MSKTTLRSTLWLLTAGLSGAGCTSILGGFDFDGPATSTGGAGGTSSTSTAGAGGTAIGGSGGGTTTSTTTTTTSGGGGQASTCSNSTKDADETDIDCGGACSKCGDGKHCEVNADCESNSCSSSKTCISCTDEIANGNETDVDCGGSACAGCAVGKLCQLGTDCASTSCVAGHCAECTPGAKQCSGATPQTCSATGIWQSSAACGGATPQCCEGSCAATVAEVVAGSFHACARMSDGWLWCWGADSFGQLGDNSVASPKRTPVQATELGNSVAQVSAGYAHTCARKSDGTAWCWGANGFGQIGDGTTASPKLTPTQVAALGAAVTQVAAGRDHTCARKTDGTLWCWGSNLYGQLGDGSTVASPAPIQVALLGNTVSAVSAGGYHTCARKADGSLWCWGRNDQGQVGDGTSGNVLSSPTEVMNSAVAQVAAGSEHTCARKTDNSLWCWGSNAYGKLGFGDLTARSTPTQHMSFTTDVVDVAAGTSGTCARTADSSLWCWGANNNGEVGDGTQVPLRLSPTKVTALVGAVAAASLGAFSKCARHNDGTVWCWGRNEVGQLGDGSSLHHRVSPRRLALGVCTSDTCIDAVKNGTETDIDCGGSCDAYGQTCGDGKPCAANADCASGACNAGVVCITACDDGVQNGSESDVDCGGTCDDCGVNKHCGTSGDCASANCAAGICQ